MLSEDEARELWIWVDAAKSWSVSAQGLVSDATELATVSRDLADVFEDDGPDTIRREAPVDLDRAALAGDLRSLATGLEDQTAEYRDRYLTTAANLEAYRSILG
jgi:hypothetical protein